MRGGADWLAGAAVSVGLHASLVGLVVTVWQPSPMPQAPPAVSEVTLATLDVPSGAAVPAHLTQARHSRVGPRAPPRAVCLCRRQPLPHCRCPPAPWVSPMRPDSALPRPLRPSPRRPWCLSPCPGHRCQPGLRVWQPSPPVPRGPAQCDRTRSRARRPCRTCRPNPLHSLSLRRVHWPRLPRCPRLGPGCRHG